MDAEGAAIRFCVRPEDSPDLFHSRPLSPFRPPGSSGTIAFDSDVARRFVTVRPRTMGETVKDAHDPELLEVLYSELRALARAHLKKERPGHTLQTTGLLHEA